GQWGAGREFLYYLGNDPDVILFWSRLPIFLLALLFGVFLYMFSRKRWGTGAGLLILFFYAFSPNFLAHSTLVTTDVGASIFTFLAVVCFARFVEKPTKVNVGLLSLALAAAELVKFSAVLLYPILGIVTLVAVWIMPAPRSLLERSRVFLGGFVSASLLSLVWVWVYYVPQLWRMPLDVQDRLISGSL